MTSKECFEYVTYKIDMMVNKVLFDVPKSTTVSELIDMINSKLQTPKKCTYIVFHKNDKKYPFNNEKDHDVKLMNIKDIANDTHIIVTSSLFMDYDTYVKAIKLI